MLMGNRQNSHLSGNVGIVKVSCTDWMQSDICLIFFGFVFISVACQNCGETIWNRPLISWNIRRKFPRATVDKTLLLCGICLHSYKYSQDYCTICFRLYDNSGWNANAIQENPQPSSSDDAKVENSSSLVVTHAVSDQVTSYDEKSMVSMASGLFDRFNF